MELSYLLFLSLIISTFNSNFALDYFIKKQGKAKKEKKNPKCLNDSCWIASHLIDKVISILLILEMRNLRFQVVR